MSIAFEDQCGDAGGHTCPICRGDVSGEFIAMVEQAAAQPGQVMTFDETMEWLRNL